MENKKYINHVLVNGHKINVFIKGDSNRTIVFLPGSGVSSPILEYKSLYENFIPEFKIVVVEKAGYGFSQSNTGAKRDVCTLVNESREALLKSGVEPPYCLVAHSYAGIESLYWANSYPDEITALLGLDMVTPQYALAQAAELSEEKKLVMLNNQKKLFKKLISSKFLQAISKKKTVGASGVLKSGILNEEEKEIYTELFYKNLCNSEIYDEQREATSNAKITLKTGALNVPCHMFISNMKTPLKNTSWLSENVAFAEKSGCNYENIDNHFAYVTSPKNIAEVWKQFINSISE